MIKSRLDEALKNAGIAISVQSPTRPKVKASVPSTEKVRVSISTLEAESFKGDQVSKLDVDEVNVGKNPIIDPLDKPIQNKIKISTEDSTDIVPMQDKDSKSPLISKPKIAKPPSPGGSSSSEPVDIAEDAVAEYSDAVSIFGRQNISLIVSNSFNQREKGLNNVLEMMKQFNAKSRKTAISATVQVLKILETDSREKCNNLYCSIFKEIVEFTTNYNMSPSMILDYCSSSFSGLLNRLSDINKQTRDRVHGLLKFIISYYHDGEYNVLPLIIKPASSSAATIPAKNVFARLSFCDELVLLYKFTKDGWTRARVEEYANYYKKSSDSQIRNLATKLLKTVSKNGINESTITQKAGVQNMKKEVDILPEIEIKVAEVPNKPVVPVAVKIQPNVERVSIPLSDTYI